MSNNLESMGLDEVSHLDIIFVNIHPVYLTSIRSTCKLFRDRVNIIIPNLYQKWVVGLPLDIIKKDIEGWTFKELIICSLTMFPVSESMKLKRKDRFLVNALLKRYPEDECLQYIEKNTNTSYSGKFHTVTEILFLAYQYGYKRIINEFISSCWDVYHRLFSSLFEGTTFERNEDDDVSEVIEELLNHPHISMDEYLSLLKICLSVELEPYNDFISGLEAPHFNEDEGNAYYPIGYFLALHVERTKLNNFLSSIGITVNIPGNKIPYQFYNNFTIDSYTNLESITNLRGYSSCLALYRPQKYVEITGGKCIFDQKIIHPYYYRVRNLE